MKCKISDSDAQFSGYSKMGGEKCDKLCVCKTLKVMNVAMKWRLV